MIVKVKDADLAKAANEGMDEFVQVIVDATYAAIGGELNAGTMALLSADQITLLGYVAMRDELMDGGFVQLIHNGWGTFVFRNPFDRAVRGWGLPDLCSLVRHAHKYYDRYHAEIERECSDDEFMAMFERYPEFDELDDQFVEHEEGFTSAVAHYVDDHLDHFCTIEQ